MDIQELFKFILHQERTIVFGNLGRYPKIIYEALKAIDLIQVRIISKHYPIITTEPRIQVVKELNDLCDLLIYIEPYSSQLIKKHPLASHVVVFTSHFTFNTFLNDQWQNVCYFHFTDIEHAIDKTQNLLKLQDPSLQTRDPGLIDVDYKNIVITKEKDVNVTPNSHSYVIIDLTSFQKDILSMYLAFWDKFDYMLEHFDSVDRWVICFSEYNGRRAFDRFNQKCIDAIFCHNFEHGNITDIQKILTLIPYYKSGIIDKKFEVPTHNFGGMKIIMPKTVEEACKSSIMYDLEHLSKNVYYIRD